MINGFTTALKGNASKTRLAASQAAMPSLNLNATIESYLLVDENTDELFGDRIFLSSVLLPDKQMDRIIDYVLSKKAKLMAVASRTLEAVGQLTARFNLSPIMLIHKLGLLDDAIIVGGVYLDNDDIDLMVQQNASLVLTPTFDAGYGNGVAPFVSCLSRGLKMELGTGDNAFNPSASIEYEAKALQLLVNATMNKVSLTDEILKKEFFS